MSHTQTQPAPVKPVRSALLTALTFGLAGPAFGTLLYATWAFSLGEEPTGIGTAVLGGLWLLPFGYMLGFAPAAFSGLIAGLAGRGLRPLPFVGLAAAVGLAVMGLLAYFNASPTGLTEGVVNLALIGGLAGGLSGGLSRALVSRTRSRS